MEPGSPTPSCHTKAFVLSKIIPIWALLLGGFILIVSFLRLGTTVQIGADEGFELAKASLCLKGFQLYTEIWDDQPPVHTFLITQVLRYLSPSVTGPRLVTVLFAGVLLTSIFVLALRVNGLFVATITTALLLASPGFIELSSSCMMETRRSPSWWSCHGYQCKGSLYSSTFEKCPIFQKSIAFVCNCLQSISKSRQFSVLAHRPTRRAHLATGSES